MISCNILLRWLGHLPITLFPFLSPLISFLDKPVDASGWEGFWRLLLGVTQKSPDETQPLTAREGA